MSRNGRTPWVVGVACLLLVPQACGRSGSRTGSRAHRPTAAEGFADAAERVRFHDWALYVSALARHREVSGETRDEVPPEETLLALPSDSPAGRLLRRREATRGALAALLEEGRAKEWRDAPWCRWEGSGAIRQHPIVLPPERRTETMPVYPEAACREGVEGHVILDLVIDREGRVHDPEVLRGLEDLSEAARRSALEDRWWPALLCGQPVPVHYHVVERFDLPEGCPPP